MSRTYEDVREAALQVLSVYPNEWVSASELVDDLQQAGVLRNLEAEQQLRQDSAAAAVREAADEMPDNLAYPKAWLVQRAAEIEGGYDSEQ